MSVGTPVVQAGEQQHSLHITGLTPGTSYTVAVTIRNKFGTSEAVYLAVVTRQEPITQLAETKVKAPSQLIHIHKILEETNEFHFVTKVLFIFAWTFSLTDKPGGKSLFLTVFEEILKRRFVDGW